MLAVIIRAEPPVAAAVVVGAAASFLLLLLSAVTTGGQLDPTGDAGRRPLPGVHGAVGAPLDGADAVRGLRRGVPLLLPHPAAEAVRRQLLSAFSVCLPSLLFSSLCVAARHLPSNFQYGCGGR